KPAGPGGAEKPTTPDASTDPAFDANSWRGTYYGLDVVDANNVVAYGLPDKQPGSVVVRTTDGGARWVGVLRLASPGDAKKSPDQDLVGVDFVDARNGAAMTDAGVVFSTADGGATWTPGDPGVLQPKPISKTEEQELML